MTPSARQLARQVVLLLLVALFAACATPAATPAAPPSTAPTLLFWYGWGGRARPMLAALVDAHNRAGGRVIAQSVPLTSFADDLRSQALAGSGPHIALVPSTWVGELAQSNAILPLDTLVPDADQRALLPVTLASARARGPDGQQRLYGAPINFETTALFYNRNNLTGPPQDTDQLLELARGLGDTRATPPLYGLAVNLSVDTMLGYLYAFGGTVYDDNGNLALGTTGRAGTERWLEWMAALNANQDILARQGSGIQVDRELTNGGALMNIGWSYQLDKFNRLWGDQLGVAPLPQLSATRQMPTALVQSQVLVVSRLASPAEQQAAAAFITALTSSTAQQTLLAADLQPARADVSLDGETPQLRAARAFRTQAEAGRPMSNVPQRLAVRSELQRMLQRVLSGQATPAQAVTDAEAALQKLP